MPTALQHINDISYLKLNVSSLKFATSIKYRYRRLSIFTTQRSMSMSVFNLDDYVPIRSRQACHNQGMMSATKSKVTWFMRYD